ncbi:MAG: glycosyltransferase 87 family protein [Myxococcota bacterium]
MRAPGKRTNAATAVALAACFSLGAALRLDAVPRFYGPEEIQRPDVYRYYASTAASALEGRGFTPALDSNFLPPPLQAAFLVAVGTVLPGADYRTARTVQAWLSAAATLLAFVIGARMGGRAVGLVAAALIAVDPGLAHFVAFLLAESNFFTLLFAFLAAFLVALERRSPSLLACSGGLLGLTCLMRPFPSALAVLLPVYLVVRGRDRAALTGAAVFALGFCVVVAPWTARNALRYGRLLPISSNGGTLLAQSNFLGLDARRSVYWNDIHRTDAWKDPEIEARFAGRVDRYGLEEWNEKDRAYLAHTLRYLGSHPLHFLRNYTIKLTNVFLTPRPRGHEDGRAPPYTRGSLMLLGLGGFVWFAVAERRRSAWVMVWVFGYFVGFTALFHLLRSGRMNFPVKLLLDLFAAYLVVALARWGRSVFIGGAPSPEVPLDGDPHEEARDHGGERPTRALESDAPVGGLPGAG